MKPKYRNLEKVEFFISDKSKEIIKQYSEYTKYAESEIVDHLIYEIVKEDKEFVAYLKSKRYAKKILSKIFHDDDFSTYEKEVNAIGKADQATIEF